MTAALDLIRRHLPLVLIRRSKIRAGHLNAFDLGRDYERGLVAEKVATIERLATEVESLHAWLLKERA